MPTSGEDIHTDTDDVRAGATPHVTRWVLLFGTIGAIVLLTAIWVIGAASSDQNNQTVDAQVRAAHDNGQNDSIATGHADQMNAATPAQSTQPQTMPSKKAGQ